MQRTIFYYAAFLLISLPFTGRAQDYVNGIGLRAGFSTGITAKHFIIDGHAVEGILTTRWQGFTITGLYEVHKSAFDTEGLLWYYGGGVHLGLWNGKYNPWFDNTTTNPVLGIDGILGMEYDLPDIPVSISLDYKPGFNLLGYVGYWGDEFALSLRYIF